MPLGSPSRRDLAGLSVRVDVDVLGGADTMGEVETVCIPMKAMVSSSSEDAMLVGGCCSRCKDQRGWYGPFVGRGPGYRPLQGFPSFTSDEFGVRGTRIERSSSYTTYIV